MQYIGGDHLEDDGWSKMMMFWNVYGWARSDLVLIKVHAARQQLGHESKGFGMFQRDVVGVAETWLI